MPKLVGVVYNYVLFSLSSGHLKMEKGFREARLLAPEGFPVFQPQVRLMPPVPGLMICILPEACRS